MQPMTIPEIISAVDGTWLNPRKGAAPVTAVCTDSRKIAPGCLFLPWVGERFDGHDFIDRALDAGAAGCLCARRPELLRLDKFYIQVADTRLALRALASAYRDRFAIPFVQVTGSVGKTTTKEMLAAVLGAALWVQIVLFFVVSIAALAATRPLVQKMLHRDETPTNADRVLGQTARVTETIDNTVPTGAVYADGKTWTARSASGRVIPKDTLVKVQRMEGVRLFVEEEAGQPVHS